LQHLQHLPATSNSIRVAARQLPPAAPKSFVVVHPLSGKSSTVNSLWQRLLKTEIATNKKYPV